MLGGSSIVAATGGARQNGCGRSGHIDGAYESIFDCSFCDLASIQPQEQLWPRHYGR